MDDTTVPTGAVIPAIVLVTAAIAKYGGKYLPFLGTGVGKALLVLITTFSGSITTALALGTPMSVELVSSAFKLALEAAGGYSLVKSLIIEPLRPVIAKGPLWLQALFGLVDWIFKSNPVAKAELAGETAVKEHPPTTVTFKDVP